ncbi:acyltransferase [Acinetobacter albensis]|uniref:Acetyltransferase (Isoleucine patch superfamily) n=1 Tax=Acinetobacter albensis TaxID=1673609 RepID=A0A1C4GX43_9GAMM|nr:acyltransferase [Acinetobacter albensis]SCC72433.1 Acetyltransferase (isoleucine patch superfamily) [Acinetobacter albensis]
MIFFKFFKLFNWFSAFCRKIIYNCAFGSQFKYFGKRTKLEITGKVKIGKNVYIGDDATIIVEKGALLTIGDNSFIGESCYIKCFGGAIEIGHDVSINSKSFINGCGGVKIGNNTRIGTQTIIISSNHNFDKINILMREQGISKKGIYIGENIWLGARTTVIDGAYISNNSVIGACSLVTKKLNESGVYVGIPAKKLNK